MLFLLVQDAAAADAGGIGGALLAEGRGHERARTAGLLERWGTASAGLGLRGGADEGGVRAGAGSGGRRRRVLAAARR